MHDDQIRREAVNGLRYGGQLMGAASARAYLAEPSAEEIAAREVEYQKAVIRSNRQQALGHTLALGRRYDSAEDAIADARVIATFLQLEID